MPTGFKTERANPHLAGVQCENCHGPASLHVETARNTSNSDEMIRKFAAPLKLSLEKARKETCIRCHDEVRPLGPGPSQTGLER